MTYGTRTGIVLLVLAHGLAGCEGSRSSVPSAPTPAPAPAPVPPSSGIQVGGSVSDTAFRPLAGVRVEVLDGAQAGMSAMSDVTGQFSLTGTFDAATTFRATKDGYAAATRSWLRNTPSARPWLGFSLAILGPNVNIAGDYTLTLVADSPCADLPSDMRRRTYAATISPSPNGTANTRFDLRLSGGSFLDGHNGFLIGVAGDYLGFGLYGGEYPTVVEQVAANAYLAFDGSAAGSVGPSSVIEISASLDGWIQYCVVRSAMGRDYDCRQAVTQGSCQSQNHRLILTRR